MELNSWSKSECVGNCIVNNSNPSRENNDELILIHTSYAFVKRSLILVIRIFAFCPAFAPLTNNTIVITVTLVSIGDNYVMTHKNIPYQVISY